MTVDLYYSYLGLIILVTGFFNLRRYIVCSTYGFHTEGELVQFANTGYKTSFYAYPVIRFTDQYNKPVEATMTSFLPPAPGPLYTKGEIVKIVYYKGRIYPAGLGWKLLYTLLFLSGTTILLLQVI